MVFKKIAKKLAILTLSLISVFPAAAAPECLCSDESGNGMVSVPTNAAVGEERVFAFIDPKLLTDKRGTVEERKFFSWLAQNLVIGWGYKHTVTRVEFSTKFTELPTKTSTVYFMNGRSTVASVSISNDGKTLTLACSSRDAVKSIKLFYLREEVFKLFTPLPCSLLAADS